MPDTDTTGLRIQIAEALGWTGVCYQTDKGVCGEGTHSHWLRGRAPGGSHDADEVPDFTVDMNAAMQVVEKLSTEHGITMSMHGCPGRTSKGVVTVLWEIGMYHDDRDGEPVMLHCELADITDLPLMVCTAGMAALEAIKSEEGKSDE